MAHTLYEDRDLNSSKQLFEGLADIQIDPEMVQLAAQLVQRQAGKYDAADLEDRYETRLRAMIDAKLKGEGIDMEADQPQVIASNVVDLIAALKQSLNQAKDERKLAKKAAAAKVTPIKKAQAATRSSRKRA